MRRRNLLNALNNEEDEVCNDIITAYKKMLKVSWSIFNTIEHLRLDHPMLNRPFVYGGNSSLQQIVVKELIVLRGDLLKGHPEHKSKLSYVLDTSG